MKILETHKILYLVLLALPVLIFLPTLKSPFFSDDYVWLLDARDAAGDLSSAFAPFGPYGFFRPLAITMSRGMYFAFGMDYGFHHAFILLLHLTNGLLLFCLSRKLLKSDLPAFLCALSFLLYPTQVPSVAWLSSLSDILLTMLFLLSMIFFRKAQDSKLAIGMHLSVFFAILAMFTRETGVLLPVLLIGLHFFIDRPIISLKKHQNLRHELFRFLPYFSISVAVLFLQAALKSKSQATAAFGFGPHFAGNFLRYFGSFLFANRFFEILSLGSQAANTAIQAAIGALLLLAVLAALFRGARAARFGAFWLLAALAIPSMFLVEITVRYLYQPLAALALVAAAVFMPLFANPSSAKKALAVSAVLLLAASFISYKATQNYDAIANAHWRAVRSISFEVERSGSTRVFVTGNIKYSLPLDTWEISSAIRLFTGRAVDVSFGQPMGGAGLWVEVAPDGAVTTRQ